MKAYLFIEGETRQAKKGEWYITSRGEIYYVEGRVTCGERNVLTRREIEVPEGAYECHGHFHNHQGRTNSFCIPIYHPKKKVKKCQYVTIGTDHCGRKRGEVTGWLTNKEAMERGLEPEDRIYQTEIEVDE